MNSSHPRSVRPALNILLGCAISFIASMPAGANPSGESVSAGSATFERDGNTLRVKTGNRTVIDWQSFSIDSGETTRFLQPSSTDVTLNRVVGADGSNIFGSLQSNGRLILLNPNGILIGATGKVDAAGFMASTLNLTNDAFLRGGDLSFIGDSQASVVNRGAIHAIDGDVFLIGRNVENSGVIEASKGTVGFGAGSEVLIKQSGDERVFVKPGTGSGAISNTGNIAAVTAELKAYGNPYALAINNAGTIRATGFSRQGGRVLLTANSGNLKNSGTIISRNSNQSGGRIELTAQTGDSVNSGLLDASGKGSGSVGGEVHLLGNRVALADSGKVDVSGAAGGGTALIGGDFHGENPLIQNSTQTLIAPGASINADAVDRGTGGRVIVWSDATTRYAGSISAKGGKLGGNGGFVEVSGKGNLQFAGQAQTGAPKGKDGTLLMDPQDITITTSGTYSAETLSNLPSSQGIALGGTDVSYSISPATLQAIQGNIILQANNDITLSAGAALNLTNQTSGERLVMQAGRHITLNSAITTSGADIYLEADRVGNPLDPGKLTINAPISTSNGGYIQLIAASFDINSTVNSGSRRSTRIAPSHGSDLTIGGTGATLTGADLDMLISTYQVWVGKAYSAGSDGLGGADTTGIGGSEITAGAINFNATTVTHTRSPILFYGSGDISINSPVTTLSKTSFANVSGTLCTFTVADGVTFYNTSGGLGLDGYDLNLQSTGAIQSKLTLGNSSGSVPIYLGNGGVAGSIQISGDELQRITASQLNLSTVNADITVDNVTAAESAQIGTVSLSAGAANGGGTGAIHFINHASTFNKLSVAANGGIDVGATLTVSSGPVNLYADQFGANTGSFSNTAAVVSTANQPILIEAADVDIRGGLTTTGAVAIQPSTSARSIGVGSGAGSFGVDQSEINEIGTNHSSLTIGRTSALNTMDVQDAAFGLPVTLQSQTIRLTGSTAVSGGRYALNLRGVVYLDGNSQVTNDSGNILFASALRDSSTGTHSLQVTATSGTITFQGAIGTGSTGALGDLTATAGGNVYFKAGTWLGGDTSISSANGSVIFSSAVNDVTSGAHSLSISAPSGSVTFQGTVGTGTTGLGSLGVTSVGDVWFKDAVALAGNTSITSSTGNILFASSVKASNTFHPTLTLASTLGNVTMQGAIGSGSNVLSTLSITAGHNASLKGAVVLGGPASVASSGGAILIGSSVNDVVAGTDGLSLDAGGGTITLNSIGTTRALQSLDTHNASVIVLNGSIATSGTQSYSSPVQLYGPVTLSTTAGDIDFLSTIDSKLGSTKALTLTTGTQGTGSVALGGDVGSSSPLASLQITSAMDLAINSALTVSGTLKLLTLGDINLSNNASIYKSLNLTARNAVVTNSGTLSLSGANISNHLELDASGPIIQTAALKVSGTSNFSGSSVVLTNASNRFGGPIGVASTGDATLVNSIATVLADSTVGGGLSLTSTGAITQSGPLNVSGLAKFVATGSGTAGAINLLGANTFGSLQLSAVNASVNQSNAMTIAGGLKTTQSLTLSSGGAIVQSGSMTVSGTFSATAGGAITLDNSSNAFAVIGNISRGGDLTLVDAKSGLILAGSITAGDTSSNVTLISNGGNLTIAGPTRTAITGQVITLVTPSLFTNSAGASALNPIGGRFLIYCHYPSALGGLTTNWIETFVSYPTAPSAGHSTGNGLMTNN